MEQKKFNVLLRDFNKKKPTFYDVLPYFRRKWEEWPYNWNEDDNEVPVKTKEELKKWIKNYSQYQFWSKCEYEIVISPWVGRNKEEAEVKIDIHDQVMLNFDRFVDYC